MAVGLVTLTVGSLFSGCGGMDLGLERSGMEIRWNCEIDPYCCRILQKWWPGVPNLGDVRHARFEEAPAVDVLAGGFPCQDLSSAGRRSGLEGKHSGLWAHFARAVEALRPGYVIVENSPALILRGIDVVLADLARLGFDAEWHCVPAAAVGAPHVRARLWLLAYPCGLGDRLPAPSLPAGRSGTVDGDWWASEPGVVRVADRAAHRVDRLRALGNSVVPQVAELIGRRVMEMAA